MTSNGIPFSMSIFISHHLCTIEYNQSSYINLIKAISSPDLLLTYFITDIMGKDIYGISSFITYDRPAKWDTLWNDSCTKPIFCVYIPFSMYCDYNGTISQEIIAASMRFLYIDSIQKILMKKWVQLVLYINPLNATGANIHQICMLSENCGIERVKHI